MQRVFVVAILASFLCGLLAIRASRADIPPDNNWRPADLPLGYILTFNVYDDWPEGSKYNDSPLNFSQLKAAAYAWAMSHGLKAADPTTGGLIEAVQPADVQIMASGGGGGGAEHLQNTFAMALLHVNDERLATEFAQFLRSQPGVAEPEIERESDKFGLAGSTPEMENKQVVINGQPYAFPQDFTSHESQDLMWIFKGTLERGTSFRAFPHMLMRDYEGKGRFDLGDVVRIGIDKNGNLTIDTLVQKWDLPQAAQMWMGGGGIAGGWALTLPAGINEKDIDPVVELSRKFDPLPGDKTQLKYTYSWQYLLLDRNLLLSGGIGSIPADQLEQSVDISNQIDQAIAEWKLSHPEVKRSLVLGDRLHGGPSPLGNGVLTHFVGLSTDDPQEAGLVAKFLKTEVPEAPEPELRIVDHEEMSRKMLEELNKPKL